MRRMKLFNAAGVFWIMRVPLAWLLGSLLLCAALAAGPTHAQQPPADARAIVRRAAQLELERNKKSRDYTYTQRVEARKLDDKGRVKDVESSTSEITILYDEEVERLIEKNDKPLSDKDRQREEDRINKLVRERESESAEKKVKRLAKQEKEREDARAFVEEIAAAYDFRFLPDESTESRPAWVIAAQPLAGYKPRRKEARILPKFRFTVWVDKAEYAWAKLDAEAIDTISFGWFLARIHKGTRIRIEQTRVNDEVWLPRHFAALLDARVALFKKYNMEVDATYRDYKKFRVDSKMTVLPGPTTPQ